MYVVSWKQNYNWFYLFINLWNTFSVFHLAGDWYWHLHILRIVNIHDVSNKKTKSESSFHFLLSRTTRAILICIAHEWRENFPHLKSFPSLAANSQSDCWACLVSMANIVRSWVAISHFPLPRNGRSYFVAEEGNKIGFKNSRGSPEEAEHNKIKLEGFWTRVEKGLAGAERNFRTMN